MKEEKNKTPLTDEYLKSIEGMQPADTDPFFYTRLKARMEKQNTGWNLPLKPVWLVAVMIILLLVNTWMIVEEKNTGNQTATTTTSPLQEVAASYDLNIPSYY